MNISERPECARDEKSRDTKPHRKQMWLGVVLSVIAILLLVGSFALPGLVSQLATVGAVMAVIIQLCK